MNFKTNTALLKQQNKVLIYRFLLAHPESTKPEISVQTGLSIPTVGQIIAELTEKGIVLETGEQESSGGRRAMAYSVNAGKKKSLGISITRHHVELILIDLSRKILAHELIDFPFRDSLAYLEKLDETARDFLRRNRTAAKTLLGTGVAIPGIIEGNTTLAYSHVLKTSRPIHLESFLGGKVALFNDATAACMAEMYDRHTPESFTFLALSDTVGGANVIDNRIVAGSANRGGEIGHICVVPGGKPCYCGKQGHYDSYGSALLLKSKCEDHTIEGFLEKLQEGDPELEQFFDEYLNHLAQLVSNLHSLTDLPVMIGGYVGNNLSGHLAVLREKASKLDIFPQSEPYILLAQHGFRAMAEGAAGYYIEKFAEELA